MPPLRRGVHKPLEEEANRILREALQGVTKHSEKSDLLTPWKEAERYRREVYVSSGTPDPAVRKGMFHRVIDPARPEQNSRDGVYRPRARGGGSAAATSSLTSFVEEFGGTSRDD